jgi:hypothetical protein
VESVEVNERGESGHLAKARRSVTKFGRFAESRGNRCNREPGLRLQEGRFAEPSSRSKSNEPRHRPTQRCSPPTSLRARSPHDAAVFMGSTSLHARGPHGPAVLMSSTSLRARGPHGAYGSATCCGGEVRNRVASRGGTTWAWQLEI